MPERFYFDINEELLKSNIVRLDGEVNEQSAAHVCAFLTALDNRNSEIQGEDGKVYLKPIWLYINSPGGSVVDGLGIIDTMRNCNSPVFTVVVGLAASMGAAIATCGDRRYATENSTIMFHEVSSGSKGKVSDMEESLEQSKKYDDLLANIIADNLHMDVKKYKKMIKKTDVYLSASECQKLNAIDVVLKGHNKEIAPEFQKLGE